MNPNERLLRQNDIIIRLLKEIRDRLPQLNIGPATEVEPVDAALEAPPASEGWEGEDQAQDGYPIPLKKDEFPHDEGDKNDAGGNTNDSIAP